MTTAAPVVWNGEQEFRLAGTERVEDTLRIDASPDWKQSERPLRLVLPTLCITYADMAFANAIGGEQAEYPASAAYGRRFFDPPVELVDAQVEKLTWIRGAHRVVIGPKATVVEWYPWRKLVIPRLRIERGKDAVASVRVTDARVPAGAEFAIDVRQLADGRQIGGLSIVKRHPDWTKPQEPDHYDLWLRVIDAQTGEPLPEAKVNLLSWTAQTGKPGARPGTFRVAGQRRTDGGGAVHVPNCPLADKQAVTLALPGWRATPRCYRPLAGQPIRFHLRAMRLMPDTIRYAWRAGDTLGRLAELAGVTEEDILGANRLADRAALRPGVRIDLPCHAASLQPDPGETFQEIANRFAYDPKELAAANGVRDPADLDGGAAIKLPGWHVFHASGNETLESFDDRFGRPKGCARVMGHVHHPDPHLPYFCEPVAVPTEAFAESHKL
jgi:LysM repeat protein